MSTTTEHFKFFKPELTDPADITELNSNWDKIDTELAAGGERIVEAVSSDGQSYVAIVPYIKELYDGFEITIIPNMTSITTNPKLDVNGLGSKSIRIPLSTNTSAVVSPRLEGFFVKNKPVKLMFDSTYTSEGIWRTVDKVRQDANDIYGTVPIASGGTGSGTPAQARKNLGATAVQTRVVTLTPSGWSNNVQTINVDGVTENNVVIITNAPTSYDDYKNYCVRCNSQGNGTLTFKCDYTPEVAITANIAIFEHE